MSVHYSIKILLILICIGLIACSSSPVQQPTINPPLHVDSQTVVNSQRPVIAFALGSGAARGFAHVGVLNVLEAHGIKADIVVGSSAGSVVGALYAGGIRGQALREAATNLETSELTDWAYPNRGVVKGASLQNYINELLQNRNIESLETKFVAVVTDLQSGKLVTLNQGDTGMAVRASSAIPGLVQPVAFNGGEYIDGGIVSPIPVKVARSLGADLVIAVDVSRDLLKPEQLQSTLSIMHQSFIIMSQNIAENERRDADILIKPEVGNMMINEFGMRELALEAGESAALQALDEIKRKIEELTRYKMQFN